MDFQSRIPKSTGRQPAKEAKERGRGNSKGGGEGEDPGRVDSVLRGVAENARKHFLQVLSL